MPIGRGIFFRQKSATEKWPQLEQIEIISADQLAKHIGSFAAPRHSDAGKTVGGHFVEDAVLLLVVEKIEIGIRRASDEMSIGSEDLHDPIGMSDRERAKKQGVNDSEDGSVHPNTERNGDKGHGKESRTPD